MENHVDAEIQSELAAALPCGRIDPRSQSWTPYAPAAPLDVKPYQAAKVKNGEAVNRALDYLLGRQPEAFLLGLDVGRYGSAFKTCKGLIDRYGPERVIDMPLCESGLVGFALGASQVGAQPIMEFQFADFSTEAASQLGLNAGTWYFRTGCPAPILLRLPCGGGLTMGAFHSGEFEGLWSRFRRPETALSGHRPGNVRGPGGRLLRPQSLPGLRAQAALLEQERARSTSTATWRPSGAPAATPKATI